MSAVFLMLGITAGAVAAWQIVKSSEQARYGSRIRELESKFRYAQGEALTLKEQMSSLRTQMAAAEKTLVDERANHTSTLAAMTASMRKGLLLLTACYFSAGLIFGGSAGWFGASWKLGAKDTSEKFQLEMDARASALKVELLERQVGQLERSSNFFERALREERVARAVAMTKLQILLESVYPQKSGGGLMLDEQELKKNLKSKIEVESYPDFPLLQSPRV